jgi:hypothetical protein
MGKEEQLCSISIGSSEQVLRSSHCTHRIVAVPSTPEETTNARKFVDAGSSGARNINNARS